ncbi:conjugal transfer protein MobA [Riemerella anatipestifer]|uniref:conjugal transfer protein MobA n=1 Tax=Bergeyella anatis TaxID=3113737 RepID=UPI002A869E5F|nr:conjugal transfer protein MobA [Riemerella anatipestifer]MDY3526041.1 conjugal transfer protein MobA [Riemerella anatipestifer]MEC5396013.1 conjugal transfer protein MobA [Bergeyella sp. RCAD1439]
MDKKHKGGRKPKIDKAIHRYTISFNSEEHEKFLSLFEQSGMAYKARFIISVLFNKEIKMVKIDKTAIDFYIKLTELNAQFRKIAVNYNQIVKILYRHFSEKKAGAYLFKLEEQTKKLVALSEEIKQVTQNFEQKHLKN